MRWNWPTTGHSGPIGSGAGLNFRLTDLLIFPVRSCLFEPVPIPVIKISDQFHLCFDKYLTEKVLRHNSWISTKTIEVCQALLSYI